MGEAGMWCALLDIRGIYGVKNVRKYNKERAFTVIYGAPVPWSSADPGYSRKPITNNQPTTNNE
jgi:hypothetical protein